MIFIAAIYIYFIVASVVLISLAYRHFRCARFCAFLGYRNKAAIEMSGALVCLVTMALIWAIVRNI